MFRSTLRLRGAVEAYVEGILFDIIPFIPFLDLSRLSLFYVNDGRQ